MVTAVVMAEIKYNPAPAARPIAAVTQMQAALVNPANPLPVIPRKIMTYQENWQDTYDLMGRKSGYIIQKLKLKIACQEPLSRL